MAMIYDTHAHLDDEKLSSRLDEVIRNAREAGVVRVNNIGCSWESSLNSVRLANEHPDFISACIGVHPSDAHQICVPMLEKLCSLADDKSVVGWGEIGLDYHFDDMLPKDVQKNAFRLQIEAAKSKKLPIIIHERDAHQDTMDILKEMHAGENGGIIHCFSGSWEMAKECLKMGFYIALGGPVTYKNAKTPVEVVAKMPLDRLLVETDCPYLAPHPFRGKINEPALIAFTAARMAEIRNMDCDALCQALTENAFSLFRKVTANE